MDASSTSTSTSRRFCIRPGCMCARPRRTRYSGYDRHPSYPSAKLKTIIPNPNTSVGCSSFAAYVLLRAIGFIHALLTRTTERTMEPVAAATSSCITPFIEINITATLDLLDITRHLGILLRPRRPWVPFCRSASHHEYALPMRRKLAQNGGNTLPAPSSNNTALRASLPPPSASTSSVPSENKVEKFFIREWNAVYDESGEEEVEADREDKVDRQHNIFAFSDLARTLLRGGSRRLIAKVWRAFVDFDDVEDRRAYH
ncbi:hypothetical protein K505DRAFT_341998 [Melanomma pulvis-pyrius CBS 109.77]|uniref:Uncharacterized protein n=1 Tax=Melanomma pulvis-pyrius CBS 109.77 TaxID=1314802 RepID=A0A6A6WXU5_9PLEO|nr:hypothetical protein K505DRAFT_341998 [Melanomma pulvis-pyrius CBS 109.77]